MEWISVKDEIPPDGKDVLFCYRMTLSYDKDQDIRRIATGFFDNSNYKYDCWSGYIEDPEGENCSLEIPLRYVTHWMPLPEPPKLL